MSFKSINNLLNGAMKRANIGRQVTAGLIVSKCNELLPEFLPEGGEQDAKVISFVGEVICVQTKSGLVCEYLQEREQDFLDRLEKELEARPVKKMTFRIGTPNEYDF